MREQVNLLDSNLATKADVAAVRAEVELLRLSTKADFSAAKAELLKWVFFGAMALQTVVIVILLRLQ